MDDSNSVESTAVEARPVDVTRAGAATGLLAVVADPVRWRLLEHLAASGTTCVCHLQPIAGVAANLLSYHLKVLRGAGLVTTARRGRWVDYTLAADALDRLHAALPGGNALSGGDALSHGDALSGGDALSHGDALSDVGTASVAGAA